MLRARLVLIGVLCATLLSAGTAKDPARGLNFYSIEHEIALGKQLSAELERQVKLADDPILVEYLNRVTQNIARQSDVTMPVTLRVIESGDLNAFTLPGGHIYITSAMLRLTESESELAFVLAHELGHVAARHATKEASLNELLKVGALPAWLVGGWTGLAAAELAPQAEKLAERKGARDFESQADRLGVDYLDRTGYDPDSAITMFERIEGAERKTPGRIARLYGTHPITAERIAAAQKHINEIDGRRAEYILNTSEYEEMRLRMVAMEAKRTASTNPGAPGTLHLY